MQEKMDTKTQVSEALAAEEREVIYQKWKNRRLNYLNYSSPMDDSDNAASNTLPKRQVSSDGILPSDQDSVSASCLKQLLQYQDADQILVHEDTALEFSPEANQFILQQDTFQKEEMIALIQSIILTYPPDSAVSFKLFDETEEFYAMNAHFKEAIQRLPEPFRSDFKEYQELQDYFLKITVTDLETGQAHNIPCLRRGLPKAKFEAFEEAELLDDGGKSPPMTEEGFTHSEAFGDTELLDDGGKAISTPESLLIEVTDKVEEIDLPNQNQNQKEGRGNTVIIPGALKTLNLDKNFSEEGVSKFVKPQGDKTEVEDNSRARKMQQGDPIPLSFPEMNTIPYKDPQHNIDDNDNDNDNDNPFEEQPSVEDRGITGGEKQRYQPDPLITEKPLILDKPNTPSTVLYPLNIVTEPINQLLNKETEKKTATEGDKPTPNTPLKTLDNLKLRETPQQNKKTPPRTVNHNWLTSLSPVATKLPSEKTKQPNNPWGHVQLKPTPKKKSQDDLNDLNEHNKQLINEEGTASHTPKIPK